jgi:Zn-finger nucleic acid-binding protein
MVKLSIPEQAHIHVEQCSVCHGVFFDAGEFTDYQEFTVGERVRLFFSTFRKKGKGGRG